MSFSNTYNTTSPGSGAANREDLSDMMYLLAPEQTPVYSNADKTKATATYHEVTVDTLAAPNADGVAEGADVTSFTDVFSGLARIGDYVQKFRRDYQVSDFQNAVDSGGLVNTAKAEVKAIRELKRDVELALCSNNDRSAEDGAGSVYKLRGLGNWIDSAGPPDVPEAFRTPADSIHSSGTFNEDVLGDLLASMARQTGASNDVVLVADTAVRSLISKTFTRTSGGSNAVYRSVNFNGNDKKISQVVETYESDFGLVSIVNGNPDCMPDTTNKDTGYLLNPNYYCIAELIPVGTSRLENMGGGDRGYIDHTLTLEMKNPLAHGKITTLS